MIKAKYTVVLKSLLDDERAKTKIDEALSSYPLYRDGEENIPDYLPDRARLNRKILNRYKYREIGFETPGRFIDELEIAMDEIMPFYNQLLKSQDIMEKLDDPFGNVDIVETFEEKTEGTSKGDTTGKTNTSTETTTNAEVENYNKNVTADTPQDLLSIPNKDIDSVNYASQVSFNHDSNTDKGTSNGTSESTSESKLNNETTGKTTHTLTRKGNQGVNTYAHDMKELRETFLNIEQMIIDDKRIRDLFMQVY